MELNVVLFDRIGKQVRLTQAGDRLLPCALDILNSVRMAESIVKEPEQISGTLRIGTCESYVIGLLPPILMDFHRMCPRVEIRIQTAFVSDLIQMLQQNDIDVMYFLDEKIYFPDWVKVIEQPQKIFFVASVDSPLAGRKQIPMDRLLQEPLCLTEKGVSYRHTMEQILAARGYELHPFLEVGNTDVITDILLQNKGISFLPEYVVKDYIADGRLCVLDTECEDVVMWSQLVYHKKKSVTLQMTLFLDMMQKHLLNE